MQSSVIQIGIFYVGINALIMMVLSIIVVKHRRNKRVGFGDADDKKLRKAVRAHGNNMEYVPIALLVIIGSALLNQPSWLIHGMGILLSVSRIAHALGMFRSLGVSMGRMLGMVGTWLTIIVGAGACIVGGFPF